MSDQLGFERLRDWWLAQSAKADVRVKATLGERERWESRYGKISRLVPSTVDIIAATEKWAHHLGTVSFLGLHVRQALYMRACSDN